MIKKTIFLLTALFLLKTNAQKKLIDSLEHEILTNKIKDTTCVNNLDHLAFLYHRNDIDKAISYMERSEELAKELNYKKGIANAIYTRGIIQMAQANYDEAITHLENAAQTYEDYGFKKSIAGSYNAIGVIHYYRSEYTMALTMYKKALKADEDAGVEHNIPNYITNIASINVKKGQYEEALKYYKKGLKIYTKNKHHLGISSCLKNIAVVYQNQGNYPLSLEYNHKALSLAKKIQDSAGIANSYNNMGLLYKKQKQYDKAIETLNKALKIQTKLNHYSGIAGTKNNLGTIYSTLNELDKAITYYEEALELNRQTDSKSQISECLDNLGYVYVTLKQYEKALNYYKESLEINKSINYKAGMCYSYLGIADCYVDQKQYDNALPNVINSLKLSDELNYKEYKKEAHKLLTEIYSIKGNYKKALENHKQYKVLNDSLFNKSNTEKIAQLEAEYKYQQKIDSASIRELKLTKEVLITSESLKETQRNYLWAVIVVLIVSIFLGSIIFFLKLKNEKNKTQKIITEQKLLRTQMTPHFIFNALSVLQGIILNKEEEKSVQYLSKFSKLLRITLENSRDKLVPLDKELLATTNYLDLQNLETEDTYQYKIQVDAHIDTTQFQIPPMLIQPFIENAIEHGFKNKNANKKIDIQLSFQNEILTCKIIDNGVGINSKAEDKSDVKNSLATTITKERLYMLSKHFKQKGAITIEDRTMFNEQGTLVTIKIPYLKTTA